MEAVPVRYDLEGQKRVYARWAPVYDAVYTKLLKPAQKRLAEIASKSGSEILEIGVGTGLVLPYYAPQTRVVGIDLSFDMLRKAQRKVAKLHKSDTRFMAAMDACRLGFADASFDVVTFPFVLTLVPDPEAALAEAARVLRPRGEIIIASRFGAEHGLQAKVEVAIAPAMKAIGWSSTFRVSRIRKWAARSGNMDLVDVYSGPYYKILRLRKAG
jgi:phosphatidylethanolamine/phosphatidyl-N-methylethanolamine N-methyltransferase